jgi:hypothetical protein
LARGRDHPRDRVDRRAQHATGAQMFGDEDEERRGRVVLDRSLNEPVRELRTVGVVRAPPLQVRQRELQVVAARLRPRAVRQKLVRRGVDLGRDELQNLVGD